MIHFSPEVLGLSNDCAVPPSAGLVDSPSLFVSTRHWGSLQSMMIGHQCFVFEETLEQPYNLVAKPNILKAEGGAPGGCQGSGHKWGPSSKPGYRVTLLLGHDWTGDPYLMVSLLTLIVAQPSPAIPSRFVSPGLSPHLSSTSVGGWGALGLRHACSFQDHCLTATVPLKWLARKCVSLACSSERPSVLLGESCRQTN